MARTKTTPRLVPLPAAARWVGYSYQRMWNTSMRGDFGQVIEQNGRLFVPEQGVKDFLTRRDSDQESRMTR